MAQISPHDWELLSAYLDNALPEKERTRLEERLQSHPELRRSLEELRRTRYLLRHARRRRAPYNFTLTPEMVRKPWWRFLVPAFGSASALATLVLIATIVLQMAIGAATVLPLMGPAAPMAAPAPQDAASGTGEPQMKMAPNALPTAAPAPAGKGGDEGEPTKPAAVLPTAEHKAEPTRPPEPTKTPPPSQIKPTGTSPAPAATQASQPTLPSSTRSIERAGMSTATPSQPAKSAAAQPTPTIPPTQEQKTVPSATSPSPSAPPPPSAVPTDSGAVPTAIPSPPAPTATLEAPLPVLPTRQVGAQSVPTPQPTSIWQGLAALCPVQVGLLLLAILTAAAALILRRKAKQ